jgi:threonine 3-dehydrogenase
MRALVKSRPEPGIWLQDVPEPAVGPNDVKIGVRRASICGTDIHIYEWDDWARKTVHVPLTLGHEFSGVVEEVGGEVRGYERGDRVSAEGHITCGYCRNCRAGRRHLCIHTVGVGVQRPGGFAEYVIIPASNVFKLPNEISDDLGAILDPFGNATHTALSFDLVGEDVLITGAGPIGVMACRIARFVGARHIVVTDVNEYRLDLARRMGASVALDARSGSIKATMRALGMTEGFDVGFEMSGNPSALRDLIDAMHHGGNVALLGIPQENAAIDWSQVIFKGLTLKGIYGREMFETWYKMASMLQSGLSIAPVITHRFPFAEYAAAFATMRSGQSGKIILEWDRSADAARGETE